VKKILVVGGAGYIGAHIAWLLQEGGYQVRIYDDFSNGLKSRVEGKFKDVVIGDVLDRKLLVDSLAGIDGVIHLAAKKAVGESVSNPLKYYENNVGGTLNILAAMSVNGVKNLIFSSTAAVYSPSEKLTISEDDKTEPLSPYGQTKLLAEKLISNVASAEGLSAISLRYFNVVGSLRDEFGDNSKDNLVPKVFAALKSGAEPEIYGDDYPTKDGTCIRDYIHVGDLAEAHILALEQVFKSKVNEIYNVGSGDGYSVAEMISQISKTIGKTLTPKIVARRAGDTAQLIASTSKIERDLGWRPKYTLKEMIDSAWQAESRSRP
jgi:UDP-glucose 4-epimerase